MLHLIYLHITFRSKRLAFLIVTLTILLFTGSKRHVFGADGYPRNHNIDILSYHFSLLLQDANDSISGIATLEVKTKDKSLVQLSLDLVNVQDSPKGRGMYVDSIAAKVDHKLPLAFKHINNKIKINLKQEIPANTYFELKIYYRGIPQDGLIISKNKFGNRTFFGDNWPNRARHWLPSVDHPYDKAYCNFTIEAPIHYEVIASGRKTEESFTLKNTKITKWESKAPLATKLMVIGVAGFAIQHLTTLEGTSIESWVFPENKEAGFHDYAMAPAIFDFFNSKIGPFAYAKLANVQSKTRYGGMENASNIFYYENSVTGKRTIENLIAHEVAHQWFGDAVTEADWNHVWLSEGFATYFTNVYVEHKYGVDSMNRLLNKQKSQIAEYHKKAPQSSIIDLKVSKLTDLLNTNTYQKGAWVLHMLRKETGDDIFFEGIRKYYHNFKNSNALTKDFQFIMEEVSGKNLDWFFEQWLYWPELPSLKTNWKYNKRKQVLELTLTQTQVEKLFKYQLKVLFLTSTGERIYKDFSIDQKEHKFEIPLKNEPSEIIVDPLNTLLLYAVK